MQRYRTIKKDKVYTGEIVEKKSRFIAALFHVDSEAAAAEFLASIRKKHYDAKHNCSAYIIAGENKAPDILHSSDDGEPSGTAGKPIMNVLTGAELKNVILVVTRYFGGTLLGTGGLVRAYTDAAKIAVENADIIIMAEFIRVAVTFDYKNEGAVRRLLDEMGLYPKDTEYSDRVKFSADIPADFKDAFRKRLTEALSGSALYEETGTFLLPDKL